MNLENLISARRTQWTNRMTFARQLQRCLNSYKMPLEEFTAKVGNKSLTYMKQELSLLKLIPVVQDMVEDGCLNHEIAFFMARLSHDQQETLKHRVVHLTLEEFKQLINELGYIPEDL